MAVRMMVRGRSQEFGQGAVAVMPAAIAALPIGLVWGALAAEHGLTPVQAVAMSAAVFACASQFVALGLWVAPLPVVAIVLATFLVNLRHIMMSASLSRKMDWFSRHQRFIAYFGLADEVWALSEARSAQTRLTPSYYVGLVLPIMLAWTVGSVAGAAFGSVLGDPRTLGFDFVLTAMFIALIAGFRRAPSWLPVVGCSAAVSTLTFQLVSGPWYVLAGSLSAIALAALLAPSSDGSKDE